MTGCSRLEIDASGPWEAALRHRRLMAGCESSRPRQRADHRASHCPQAARSASGDPVVDPDPAKSSHWGDVAFPAPLRERARGIAPHRAFATPIKSDGCRSIGAGKRAAINHKDEVTVIYFYCTEQDTSNASFHRGTLFEELLRIYLRGSGFEVDVQRRKTSSLEYDLHGRHRVDDRPLIGEAKAHTETIGGKEVSAFVGKALPFLVQSPPYSAIFLSISSLSPEAEDYLRNLHATTSFRLSVKCGSELESHIREVLQLPTLDQAKTATRELVPVASTQSIVHTNRGTFIAVVGAGQEGAFDDRFALVSSSGSTVGDQALLQMLRTNLPALQELEAVREKAASSINIPAREIPSGLITAVDWLDYRRPAGAAHFVGRAKEIQRAGELVGGRGAGLVLELKARSGVGKSSLLSVLAHQWATAGHRVELHDARDVQSGEDVLKLIQRFVGPNERLTSFEEANNAIGRMSGNLSGKHAVFMVDQFESTFLAPEVYTAYEYLALCIARGQWPVSMLFSRKDDLLTTHDDMFVSLDRLRGVSESISLEDFSQAEAQALIQNAAAGVAIKISPKVLTQVLEFAQGFPWLLKRTLAHVFTISASGTSQTELLSSGLHLSDLFEEELAELDEHERGYLTRVAAVLPATYHALARRFDDDPFLRPMLEKLTHRKLLRFSAGTYDTYNDVFKDFLLYERMPEQGQSELLRIGLVSVMQAFRAVGGDKRLEPGELAEKWDKPLTGVYNVLRDMRLAGLVVRTQSGWEVPDVVRQYEHQGRLGEFVRQSVLRNRIAAAFIVDLEKSGKMSRSDAALWLRDRFPFVSVRDEVWHQYATTLSDWLARLNLAEISSDFVSPWRGNADAAKELGNLAVSGRGARPKKAVFVPSTNWVTVCSVWKLIAKGAGDGMNLRRGEHAARQDLLKLDAITEEAGKRFRVREDFLQFEARVRALLETEPYASFWAHVKRGDGFEIAARALASMEDLAPGTRDWLCKKLSNWGRQFELLPRGFRAASKPRRLAAQQASLRLELESEGPPNS